MSKPTRLFLVAFAILAIALLAIILPQQEASSQTRVLAIVKLYSGGALAAKWDAVSVGRAEGDTYVFTTAYGTKEQVVRIRGTYSVETIPQ